MTSGTGADVSRAASIGRRPLRLNSISLATSRAISACNSSRWPSSSIEGVTEGVTRYTKNGKFIDLASDGRIVSFGKQ